MSSLNFRTILGFGLIVVLAGVYVIFFSHWFDKEPAQGAFMLLPPKVVHYQVNGRRTHKSPPVFPVTFCLDKGYEVTSIKAIPMIDISLDPNPEPIWDVQAADKPVKMQIFNYGQGLAGMKPVKPKTRPTPLLPDRPYRLIIQTLSGEEVHIDFQTKSFAKAG